MSKQITVIGAGYVGLTSAAVFANAGFETYCLDIDKERIEAVQSGQAFFYEQGLDNLIQAGLENDTLKPTLSYADACENADLLFSCVGTPDNPDGSSNLSFVYSAAETAAPHLKDGAVYVQKSTVPVGTGKEVERILKNHKNAETVHYASNPEFLRESTAVGDLLDGDRIVVGASQDSISSSVFEVYQKVMNHKESIAKTAGLSTPETDDPDFIATAVKSAELVKVSANAFLALKISFANSMAKLADQAQADVTEIMDAVGADRRIGRDFFNAGRGYGGGCFPKDVSGLIDSAAHHGIDLSIMSAAQETNESMPGYIANKTQAALGGDLEGKKVTVLGLAFKPGTSDARKSPSVKIANILAKKGARVRAFDPEAMAEAQTDLRRDITPSKSAEAACKEVDAVIVATPWAEFQNLGWSKIAKTMNNATVFVDGMNAYKKREMEDYGFKYIGVGR